MPLGHKRLCLHFFILFITVTETVSQNFTTEDYYLFPINTGQTNYLAGTMGEMRSTHFHGGIDIRTGGKTGLPIYASADGYISRIKISSGGYGHALYMYHPNNTYTVYAHMERFDSALEQYTIDQQYEKKSYGVDLFPEKNLFYFRKGEIIGYSGNTGSSSGPHLHFEIRDKNQRVMDPLRFDFEEIVDNIPPRVRRVAFVTLDGASRINGAFGRYEFDVIKVEGKYRTRKPIQLKGRIGIEMLYFDQHDGSGARNGAPEILLRVNGDTLFSQKKRSLSFALMRNILVHMNYETFKGKGLKFNKLYVDEGNNLDIYHAKNNGIFFDDEPAKIEILIQDTYGNLSHFESTVNYRKLVYPQEPEIYSFKVMDNHLQFADAAVKDEIPNSTVFANGLSYSVSPYISNKKDYYLWDLRDGLPDSIVSKGKSETTNFISVVPSNQPFNVHHQDYSLRFRTKSLYDTLYLRYSKSMIEEANSEQFEFYHGDVPLRQSVTVTLKPELTYSEKAHVYSVYKRKLNYMGGKWEDGKITFRTRDLVKFTIAEDNDPPVVETVRISEDNIEFRISDKMSGINDFKAHIDGQWLLMSYDPKRRKIKSVKKDQTIKFEGQFTLEVLDNAGNSTTITKTIENS